MKEISNYILLKECSNENLKVFLKNNDINEIITNEQLKNSKKISKMNHVGKHIVHVVLNVIAILTAIVHVDAIVSKKKL